MKHFRTKLHITKLDYIYNQTLFQHTRLGA